MKFKRVGRIAEEISALGLGCWAFSGEGHWDNSTDDNSVSIIHAALDMGVNLLDVAPIYGRGRAETVVGRAIRGRKRDSFLIASKCGLLWDPANPKHEWRCLKKESVLKEIDDSLRRLGTDYIDIYQLHWPDSGTPIGETLEAIAAIKKAGKIRHFGLTNYNTEQVKAIDPVVRVDSQQGLYNMLERNPRNYHADPLLYRTERETLPQCLELGQAFFPYSPMFQGLLSGSFAPSGNFSDNDVRRSNVKLNGERFKVYYDAMLRLKDVAERHGHPLNELTVNWLVSNPAVTSVIGSALTADQLQANAKALEWDITPEMRSEIDMIIAPFEDQ